MNAEDARLCRCGHRVAHRTDDGCFSAELTGFGETCDCKRFTPKSSTVVTVTNVPFVGQGSTVGHRSCPAGEAAVVELRRLIARSGLSVEDMANEMLTALSKEIGRGAR